MKKIASVKINLVLVNCFIIFIFCFLIIMFMLSSHNLNQWQTGAKGMNFILALSLAMFPSIILFIVVSANNDVEYYIENNTLIFRKNNNIKKQFGLNEIRKVSCNNGSFLTGYKGISINGRVCCYLKYKDIEEFKVWLEDNKAGIRKLFFVYPYFRYNYHFIIAFLSLLGVLYLFIINFSEENFIFVSFVYFIYIVFAIFIPVLRLLHKTIN